MTWLMIYRQYHRWHPNSPGIHVIKVITPTSLTTDFDLHRADSVKFCHPLNFRKHNFGAI